MLSPEYTAGSGEGIQPDSSVFDEYARPPACRRPNSSPAATRASRTSSPSSQGPKSSQPGCPTMPCRNAPAVLPAIVTAVVWKNSSSGGGSPSAFSITCIALGPCTWNRYDLRRPSVRSAVLRSSSTVTSYPPVSAWYMIQLSAGARPSPAGLRDFEDSRRAPFAAPEVGQ